MPKEVEPLMTPQEMKPILKMSKRQPIYAAIAFDKEKNAIVLLDKKKKPRKLRADMIAMAKKQEPPLELNTSSIRFGTAEVDSEDDPRCIKFTMNKEPPGGMEIKLKKVVKLAGFGEVEFVVDEKIEEAPEEESEDGNQPAQAARPAAAAGDQPAGAAQPQQGNGADMGALSQQLTGLVKRMMGMMGANPAAADAMKTAAMEGQAALKTGDAQGVQGAIDTLKRMLDAASGAAAAGGAAGAAGARAPGAARNAPGSPVFKTAQVIWDTARKMVEGEIAKLAKELQATYKDHPIGGDITSVFEKKVEPVLANLDKKLSDKLAEVQKEKEAAAHGKLVTEAKAIITQYQQYLAGEKLIQQLDTNPFVDLKIEETLNKSLTQLAKAVV